MAFYGNVTSGADVAAMVEGTGRMFKRLGTALGGAPIQAVRLGGEKKPAVIIKAGSHASEIAGVHGALTLIDEGIDTEHEVWVIPCGDPFGFDGYRKALAHAAGAQVAIADDEECLAALDRFGRRFHEGEHFALFDVNGIVFCWADQARFDARALFYGQMDRLARRDPRLRAEIAGKRILYPNAVYYRGEGQGPYDHGALVSVVSPFGMVNNMNGFFDRTFAPEEVACVREFCREIRPGLAIDLHESCINTRIPQYLRDSDEDLGDHFLILPEVHGPGFEAVETPVAEAMLEGTRRAGHECFTRKHLEASWGYDETDYYPGYVRFLKRGACSFYKWALLYAQASIVVEPRMDRPCAERAQVHTAAVRAGIEKYAEITGARL